MFVKQLEVSAVKRLVAGGTVDCLPKVKFCDGELRIALHVY